MLMVNPTQAAFFLNETGVDFKPNFLAIAPRSNKELSMDGVASMGM